MGYKIRAFSPTLGLRGPETNFEIPRDSSARSFGGPSAGVIETFLLAIRLRRCSDKFRAFYQLGRCGGCMRTNFENLFC